MMKYNRENLRIIIQKLTNEIEQSSFWSVEDKAHLRKARTELMEIMKTL